MNNIVDKSVLTDSKTFCMLPFVHLNTTPNGSAYPCCNSANSKPLGNTNQQSVQSIINSTDMKQLRVNMMTGVRSEICNICYQREDNGEFSGRLGANADYKKHFATDVVNNVDDAGQLSEFRMRYFDIRFSNICNFKCRTCGPEFSSLWEQEYKTVWSGWPGTAIKVKNNRGDSLLQELKGHIQHMDAAYFAGGEPLITEEHYVLLEEMIRQNRTDIKLRYNTNLSNLQYKDRDLLALWAKFPSILIMASLDHYGPRAEYIRKGTVWHEEVENIKKIRSMHSIRFMINTVVSIYNYQTLDEFYYYLIDNGIIKPKDIVHTLYNLIGPEHLSAQALPKPLKEEARERIKTLAYHLADHNFSSAQVQQVTNVIKWVDAKDTWDIHSKKFLEETAMIDQLRGENFAETFPEFKPWI